jgi:chemotaxis protein CheX
MHLQSAGVYLPIGGELAFGGGVPPPREAWAMTGKARRHEGTPPPNHQRADTPAPHFQHFFLPSGQKLPIVIRAFLRPIMVSPVLISETLVQNCTTRAVQNVCRTMLRREATLQLRESQPMAAGSCHLMASVGFVGEISGVVYLCMKDDFAAFAICQVLGLEPGDAEVNDPEVIRDAIGEIANMTVGGFKNQLCDAGFPCRLTLPTIFRGADLQVSALKDTSRHVFEFECDGHILAADIQFKVG